MLLLLLYVLRLHRFFQWPEHYLQEHHGAGIPEHAVVLLKEPVCHFQFRHHQLQVILYEPKTLLVFLLVSIRV